MHLDPLTENGVLCQSLAGFGRRRGALIETAKYDFEFWLF
jgi:hypothetical protein